MEIKSFKEFLNESDSRSQKLADLNVSNHIDLYMLATKVKSAKEFEDKITSKEMMKKFADKDVIDFSKVNWEKIYRGIIE